MAIETYFKNIADAIREKAGTSGLITPAQMPQAITDIPTGGDNPILTPISYDNPGYISSDGKFVAQNPGSWYRTDIFEIKTNEKYIMYMGELTSNMVRVARFTSNPLNLAPGSNISGTLLLDVDNTSTKYYVSKMLSSSNAIYLVVDKSHSNRSGIKSYVVELSF